MPTTFDLITQPAPPKGSAEWLTQTQMPKPEPQPKGAAPQPAPATKAATTPAAVPSATPTATDTPAATTPQPPTVQAAPIAANVAKIADVPTAPQLSNTDPNTIKPRLSYEDMARYYLGDGPETPEQRKKREKKERRERMFAAISDGISSLANLYFTSHYAPNAYNHQQHSAQTRVRAWQQQAEQERKGNARNYLAMMMQARQADQAQDQADRQWQRQLGIDADEKRRKDNAEKRAAAKDKREQELHPLVKAKAEADATKAGIQASYAPLQEGADLKRKAAQAAASAAQGVASRATADYYNRKENGDDKYIGSFGGKSYRTENDYNKAVSAAARQWNKEHPEQTVSLTEEQVLERNYNGKPLKTKTVSRPMTDVAAELEALYAEENEIIEYKPKAIDYKPKSETGYTPIWKQ